MKVDVGSLVTWETRLGGRRKGIVLYFEGDLARVRVKGLKGWTKTAYYWKKISELKVKEQR